MRCIIAPYSIREGGNVLPFGGLRSVAGRRVTGEEGAVRERLASGMVSRLPVAIILVALALRLAVLVAGLYPLESDEAIVGLMARHILAGERPIFYYGQPYMGAVEAYLVAPVFWGLGSSTLALRLAPLALSLLFVCLTYLMGCRVYGPVVGTFAAAYVAVSPPFLTMWSLKARGGYIETLVLGEAILLLTIGIASSSQTSVGHWLALGFLTGLALWVNELILPYLVAALVTLFWGRRGLSLGRGGLIGLIGAALGGLPLWVYNWQHPLATFMHLVESNAGAGMSLATVAHNLLDLFRYAVPVLMGALPSTSCLECFHEQRIGAGTLYYLSLSMVAVLALAAVWGHCEPAGGQWRLCACLRREEVPLLVLLLTSPLLFITSQVGFLHYSEPRYLLPLYSTVPVFVAAVWRLLGERPRYLAALLLAVLAFNLQANWTVDPALAMPVIEGQRPAPSNRELASFLEARGIRYVYTDYWIAYTLAFESDEKVIPSVVGPALTVGYNRYVPYAYSVSVAENPAYVFLAGSQSEAAFAAEMKAEGGSFQREVAGPYAVYWNLNPLRRPR